MLAEASTRRATDPARMDKFIAALSQSRAEQKVAVERLREAGPFAIPPLIRALSVSGLDASVRTPLAENLGQLDRKAVPALIAALDSTDDAIVGDVARALGQIGDARAVPALTYLAARTKPETAAKPLVLQAIRELTGKTFPVPAPDARPGALRRGPELPHPRLQVPRRPGRPLALGPGRQGPRAGLDAGQGRRGHPRAPGREGSAGDSTRPTSRRRST